MTTKKAFWKWAALGAVVAILLLVGQANAVGGLAGLLHVGEVSDVRARIEAELGEVPLVANTGHDAQIYYAIGLDLRGDAVPDELDHGGYRYRRILFPALASVFGLFDGEALLMGMIAVTIISTAVVAGATAAIASHFKRSDWFALAVVLNPGVWLSVRLLTADILAMALMMAGLYYFVTGRRWGAVAMFAVSGLAKDVYLATPGGLAFSRERRRWGLIVVPALILIGWMTILTVTMGEGFTGRGNLALPFTGVVKAAPVWLSSDAADRMYVLFALVSVAAGLAYGTVFRSWLRWSILGWSLLAVVSSNWVWDLGNNAARAFAPIVVLVALAVAGSTRDGMSDRSQDRLTVSE